MRTKERATARVSGCPLTPPTPALHFPFPRGGRGGREGAVRLPPSRGLRGELARPFAAVTMGMPPAMLKSGWNFERYNAAMMEALGAEPEWTAYKKALDAVRKGAVDGPPPQYPEALVRRVQERVDEAATAALGELQLQLERLEVADTGMGGSAAAEKAAADILRRAGVISAAAAAAAASQPARRRRPRAVAAGDQRSWKKAAGANSRTTCDAAAMPFKRSIPTIWSRPSSLNLGWSGVSSTRRYQR